MTQMMHDGFFIKQITPIPYRALNYMLTNSEKALVKKGQDIVINAHITLPLDVKKNRWLGKAVFARLERPSESTPRPVVGLKSDTVTVDPLVDATPLDRIGANATLKGNELAYKTCIVVNAEAYNGAEYDGGHMFAVPMHVDGHPKAFEKFIFPCTCFKTEVIAPEPAVVIVTINKHTREVLAIRPDSDRDFTLWGERLNETADTLTTYADHLAGDINVNGLFLN